MKIIIAIPVAHTYFFQDSCISQLQKFDPGIRDVQIVVVSNAYEWCPSIRNIMDWSMEDDLNIPMEVTMNDRQSKWHGTALDHVVEHFEADYLFTMEPDVLVLQDDWLKWFVDQMKPDIFSIGHWHGEGFINPSATLYRMSLLKEALGEFRANQDPYMYWGPNFERKDNILAHYDKFLDDVGPFSEKRGWPPGTKLKGPVPSGQLRGPGWYEPAQQLHHWAVEKGYSYIPVPCRHDIHPERCIPTGTFYGEEGNFQIVHLWGGTRALDLLKHPVEDPTVNNNMGYWLEREAEIWCQVVPRERQERTLELLSKNGWFTRDMTEREMEAVKVIEGCYRKGGIDI